MSKFNLKRGRISQKLPRLFLRRSGIFLPMLIVLSLVLSGCQVYNGYPTVTPLPTAVPTATAIPPTIDAADFPTPTPELPFPTDTPRPPLPTPAGNVASKQSDLLQKAFDGLFQDFYRQLDSADIFQVGLDGLIAYLKQKGITNPQVPLPNFTGNRIDDNKLFFQSYNLALAKYQSQIDEQQLAYAIINAETNALNECSTAFYPPDQTTNYFYKLLGESPSPTIGITIIPVADGLLVWHVTPDSPADKGGLKMGDIIVEVNGTTLKGMSAAAMSSLLRGGDSPQVNSQVTIQLQHAGSSQTQQITLTRRLISPPHLESQLINNDVGYIRLNPFSSASDSDISSFLSQLDDTISQFNNQKVKGFVLDLRNNQYGLIPVIQQELVRFTNKDPLLGLQTSSAVSEAVAGTTPGASEAITDTIVGVHNTQDVTPINKPLAVVIDQNTSGGGVMMAASLQGQQHVQLFGNETAPCSTLSIVVPLTADNSSTNDAALLTVGLFKPVADNSGNAINSVTPDVAVDLDVTSLQQGHDSQLDKAVQYIEGS